MTWAFLKSRGFWVAAIGTVSAGCVLAGVDGDKTAIVVGALTLWMTYAVVGAVRPRGMRSREQVMKVLRDQEDEIRELRFMDAGR